MVKALDVMKGQAGTRFIGSFIQAGDFGKSRITTHYANFNDFVDRMHEAINNGYEVSEPVFNNEDAWPKLRKLWKQ